MKEKDVTTIYKGIKITVLLEDSSFKVYFNNASGEYSIPPQGVERLEDQPSYEVALDAGKKFVDKHQWEFIEKFDIFDIYIRYWWNNRWGYSIRCGGATSCFGFSSSEAALIAARAEAKKQLDEITSCGAMDVPVK